jgi:hypothetical protein
MCSLGIPHLSKRSASHFRLQSKIEISSTNYEVSFRQYKLLLSGIKLFYNRGVNFIMRKIRFVVFIPANKWFAAVKSGMKINCPGFEDKSKYA